MRWVAVIVMIEMIDCFWGDMILFLQVVVDGARSATHPRRARSPI